MRYALLALLAITASAQTTINGSRTILGEWNAGGAAKTIPMRKGGLAAIGSTCTQGEFYYATDAAPTRRVYECRETDTWVSTGYYAQDDAPATCSTGEVWFDTNASAGANWHGCTSANTWTALGGTSTAWKAFFAGGDSSSLSASLTRYLHINDVGIASSVERNVSIPLPRAGTLRNLYVYGGPTGTGASVTCTVYKAASGSTSYSTTGIAVTLTPSAAEVSDTSNSASVTAGDHINLRCVTNSSVTGGVIRTWTLEYASN